MSVAIVNSVVNIEAMENGQESALAPQEMAAPKTTPNGRGDLGVGDGEHEPVAPEREIKTPASLETASSERDNTIFYFALDHEVRAHFVLFTFCSFYRFSLHLFSSLSFVEILFFRSHCSSNIK